MPERHEKMPERITLDYNLMLTTRLGEGRGIEPERLETALLRLEEAETRVSEWRAEGRLGFYDLVRQTGTIEMIEEFTEESRGRFEDIVVLGIGGSALGTRALRDAILDPGWNELPPEAREGRPRLHILDNIDPTTIRSLLERIDLKRTLFNVVSKSGTTAETMAQFLVVQGLLREEIDGSDYREHLVLTTDPEGGFLRALADEEQINAFPIPPNVGGRFSVLSPVGLLPAALVGIDIEELLDGARDLEERCRETRLEENPAAIYALLQYLADTEQGARVHVLMPYSDRLAAIGDWFVQLWAESLGKRFDLEGNEIFTGPTPVKAIGATDQHSQTQLYMEGPFDKTITFLTLGEYPADLEIPGLYPEAEALAYLGGHTLAGLLEAEQRATALALARAGRMNMTIEMPTLRPHMIGQLLMFFQIATVYAGALYGIDPLDQPGVELGKELTYGLMGRDGYEAPARVETDTRWIAT